MKKIIYFLLLLGFVWFIKMSYDWMRFSQKLPELEKHLVELEQSYTNLNDRYIALQRDSLHQPLERHSTSSLPKIALAPIEIGIPPQQLIKQQLELIQFAIQQQQYIFAFEKMDELQKNIPRYEMPDVLKKTLGQGLEKDRQSLQKYVMLKMRQQQSIALVLKEIDQYLEHDLSKTTIDLEHSEEKSFWSKWFQFEKVEKTPVDLMYRQLLLKEIQLRLLLAQQALNQGQTLSFQHEIESIVQKTNQLPSGIHQKIQSNIQGLLIQPSLATPSLSALALLGQK